MRIKNLWAIQPDALHTLLSQWRGLGQIRLTDEQVAKAAATATARAQGVAGIDDATRVGYPVRRRGDTAIVTMRGPMMKDPGWILQLYYGVGSTSDITAALKIAGADDTVKNILLLVDSPGGEVDGIGELQDAINAIKASKPVVGFADGMAASLAYWAISQTNKVYMDRLSCVGSIGVFMALYDFSAMYEAAGVKTILLTTGDHKGAGVEGTTITPEQQAEFQRVVDLYFDAFTSAVKEGRDMSAGDVKKVSDGRVFIGQEAKTLGLVDAIQSLDQTLANIDSNKGLRKRAQAETQNQKQALALKRLPDID